MFKYIIFSLLFKLYFLILRHRTPPMTSDTTKSTEFKSVGLITIPNITMYIIHSCEEKDFQKYWSSLNKKQPSKDEMLHCENEKEKEIVEYNKNKLLGLNENESYYVDMFDSQGCCVTKVKYETYELYANTGAFGFTVLLNKDNFKRFIDHSIQLFDESEKENKQ